MGEARSRLTFGGAIIVKWLPGTDPAVIERSGSRVSQPRGPRFVRSSSIQFSTAVDDPGGVNTGFGPL